MISYVDELGTSTQALDDYSYVVERHGDLALAEYARIGRALLLYQVGVTGASFWPVV
jgi:hypothetical protein